MPSILELSIYPLQFTLNIFYIFIKYKYSTSCFSYSLLPVGEKQQIQSPKKWTKEVSSSASNIIPCWNSHQISLANHTKYLQFWKFVFLRKVFLFEILPPPSPYPHHYHNLYVTLSLWVEPTHCSRVKSYNLCEVFPGFQRYNLPLFPLYTTVPSVYFYSDSRILVLCLQFMCQFPLNRLKAHWGVYYA